MNNACEFILIFQFLQSAVTHSDGGHKTRLDAVWVPDMSFVGQVKMVATVVKGFFTFWVKVPSETVVLSNLDVFPDSGFDIMTFCPELCMLFVKQCTAQHCFTSLQMSRTSPDLFPEHGHKLRQNEFVCN